ncbi:MAG: hypothetical protein ACI4S1_13620 [Roseburia sp.]
MSEPIRSFAWEILNIDDVVVYLKDGCKFIGQITEFVDTKVKIRRLSPPNTFVTPDKTQDYGEVDVSPDDVVHIIISKYDISMSKTLAQANNLIHKYETELDIMRRFIYEYGLESELASTLTLH